MRVLLGLGDRGPLHQRGRDGRVQHMAGRTHPGTECRAVSGLLVVCVLGFVGDRLRRRQASHREDAEDHEAGNGLRDDPGYHYEKFDGDSIRIDRLPVECYGTRRGGVKTTWAVRVESR